MREAAVTAAPCNPSPTTTTCPSITSLPITHHPITSLPITTTTTCPPITLPITTTTTCPPITSLPITCVRAARPSVIKDAPRLTGKTRWQNNGADQRQGWYDQKKKLGG
ncbi:hypothetical protein E2C01_065087 [Portunus trituberculatus]|uniref:Uncharacterized protein n=1 Tax=Portunus trituberculatus TaxID=210409 RepID=A0A5B7HNN6_PORTR|nr:hypothetical protein [Portunus trituberculatus]